MPMTTLLKTNPDKRITILVWGKSSVGKEALAGSREKQAPRLRAKGCGNIYIYGEGLV